MTDDEYKELQEALVNHPNIGKYEFSGVLNHM